ncbi:recombinase family protein [Nocardia brasiliensis]|uniref:recombinase family protein n=1 Tax=Nocardia brasiliensis TaxID=37326 RepID=UPI002456328D|nr:recombinase family protein [Nocardia brasiliensis]
MNSTVRPGPGRPMLCPQPVLSRVLTMRQAGMSYSAISTALNQEGIATPSGGTRWQRCHVWRLVRTAAAARLLNTRYVN